MIKVSLEPIYKSELKKLIELAFEGDIDLFEKYHISPGSFQHCVDETFKFISDQFLEYDMDYYKISLFDGKTSTVIGYTVTVINEKKPHDLYSYGINEKYRTKEILTQWLFHVEQTLGLPFYTALHNVNTRAIEFFKKNGFEVYQHNSCKILMKQEVKQELKELQHAS